MPIGYIWHREIGLGFDPDRQIQEVASTIFVSLSRAPGSARQVLLSMLAECSSLSAAVRRQEADQLRVDADPVTVILVSTTRAPTPTAKARSCTAIVDGRARTSYGHRKPLEEWEVLLKDHHEGYIGWAEFERNQTQLVLNNYAKRGRRSRDAAGARCWPGCYPAAGAVAA